jgi:hypothetical protein
MKKLFLLFFVLISFVSFGQLSGTILTTARTINSMNWSELDKKFIFFETVPRGRSNWRWIFDVDQSKIGNIQAEDLNDNEWFKFNVYDWENINMEGATAVIFKTIQQNGGQKVEIIVAKYPSGNQMISVFINEDDLAVYFDNFPKQ